MKIIYIAGYGHSGSTLIGKLLGSSKKNFYIGESQSLYYWVNKNHKYIKDYNCDCGSDIESCPFWSQIIHDPIKNPKARDKLKVLKEIFFPGKKNHCTTKVFGIIDKLKPGAENIIDSSKNVAKLVELISNRNINVDVIHLIRDPRGVAWSREKTGSYVFKTMLDWLVTNTLVSIVKFRNKSVRFHKVSYNKFTEYPESFYEPFRLNAYTVIDDVNNETYHSFCGNVNRNRKLEYIKQDDSWKKNLKGLNLLMANITYVIGRIFWGEL